MLKELLAKETAAVAQQWLGRALEVYPPDTRAFYNSKRDQFANPVGEITREATRALLDCLLDKATPELMRPPLEKILRIRSVQELSPAQALSFLFLLKNVVRDVLKDELKNPVTAKELSSFEGSIDSMVLLAFNIYTEFREKVCEIRVSETKRNVSEILKRSGFIEDGDTELNSEQR